ncbi:hypothetical protein V865_007929 [Kwoniella europaea PYCC6329]|uniref:Uncharacterized protein n=1 Tax=Kwoniella europaea PYCC6329 TaxID=1423913 RepID=A0AAX4KTS7_9TREE
MKLIFLLSLIPVALSLPQPQPSSEHPINLPPHVQNFAKKRAFGAGDTGIQGTSVASEKDTSTLTSLIMFQPSSEPTTTVTGTTPVSSAASSSSSSDEDDQIVSPFYPSTNDDEEESDDSVQTLGQGQSAAFNPTPSTTLSLLTNSLATASATANGTKSSTTGSASAAVVAAASDTGSSISGSLEKMNGVGKDRILILGSLGVVIAYLA